MLQRYEIKRVQCNEKTGCIFVAKFLEKNCEVYLKTFESTPFTANYALEEARLLNDIGRHPNLLRCFEAFVVPNISTGQVAFYLSMEYCPGGSLREQIEQNSQAFSEVLILHRIHQLGSALAHMHKHNLEHKAVCTWNVFMCCSELHSEVLLGNFLPMPTSEDALPPTPAQGTCETNTFTTPESLPEWTGMQTTELAGKADMWGLGCVMLEMMTRIFLDRLPHVGLRERSLAYNMAKDKEGARAYLSRKFVAGYSLQTQRVLFSLLHPDPYKRCCAEDLCQIVSSKDSPLAQQHLPNCYQHTAVKGDTVTTSNVRLGMIVEQKAANPELDVGTGVIIGLVPAQPNKAIVYWEKTVARLANPNTHIGYQGEFHLSVSAPEPAVILVSKNPAKYQVGQVTQYGILKAVDLQSNLLFLVPSLQTTEPGDQIQETGEFGVSEQKDEDANSEEGSNGEAEEGDAEQQDDTGEDCGVEQNTETPNDGNPYNSECESQQAEEDLPLPSRIEADKQLQQAETKTKSRFPSYWKPFEDDTQKEDFLWWKTCRFVDLDRNSSEWAHIEGSIKATVPSASLEGLQRVQHRLLWAHYTRQRDLLKLKNGDNCNEKWLFHGTRNVAPHDILMDEDGLDNRFSNPGSWGRGIYFAENACYSAPTYCYQKRDAAGRVQFQIFYARVAVGRSKYFDAPQPDLKLPPYILPENDTSDSEKSVGDIPIPIDKSSRSLMNAHGHVRYDSVSSKSSGSTIYVVYKNDQIYPEYVATFKINDIDMKGFGRTFSFQRT